MPELNGLARSVHWLLATTHLPSRTGRIETVVFLLSITVSQSSIKR